MRTALVLGSASCLFDDLEEALEITEYSGVVACNEAGIHFPGNIDAWVSYHPQNWVRKGWREKRAANGYPNAKAFITHTQSSYGPIKAVMRPYETNDLIYLDHLFPGQKHAGSSGLFAAKVALIDLGYDRAVLCGIPMTPTPHYGSKKAWAQAEGMRKAWVNELREEYRARMRSMSGFTRLLLGGYQSWSAKDAETRQYNREQNRYYLGWNCNSSDGVN